MKTTKQITEELIESYLKVGQGGIGAMALLGIDMQARINSRKHNDSALNILARYYASAISRAIQANKVKPEQMTEFFVGQIILVIGDWEQINQTYNEQLIRPPENR